jgi:hypothetical protein
MRIACGAVEISRGMSFNRGIAMGSRCDDQRASTHKTRPTKTKRHGSDSVAFCSVVLLVRQTREVRLHRFALPRTFATLTGLRPMPEQLPMQQRPKRQRLRPKQQS